MKHCSPIICLLLATCILSLFSGYALSQSDTAHPTLPVAVPVDVYSGIVGCGVNGYVLDTNGNPVSDAIVTVRQNGEIYRPSEGILGNPQVSQIYSYDHNDFGSAGYFQFGAYDVGNYTITAEKDGYNSSVNVPVTNVVVGHSVSQNITLNGYYVPAFSKDQLAYMGAIVGVVLDRDGVILSYTNVSLWQNGRLVKIPHNPQYSLYGKNGDEFLFEHVPPGHYQLLADETNRLGDAEGMAVDVDNSPVTANVTMHNYTHIVMGPPPQNLDTTPIPSQMTPSDTPKPTPFTGGLFVGSSIIAAALIYAHKKKV